MKRLAVLKERRGYSQNKVNALAGFSQGYITRVKNGDQTDLGIEYLERLAAALEAQFEWLTRGIGPEELPPDPKEWEELPPAAWVALRVVTGRGQDGAAALARIRKAKLSMESSTMDYLRVLLQTEGARPAKPAMEFSPILLQALAILTVRNPNKAPQYVAVARRLITNKPRTADPERVAEQIEGMIAKGKASAADPSARGGKK